jgi:hypothetical protein
MNEIELLKKSETLALKMADLFQGESIYSICVALLFSVETIKEVEPKIMQAAQELTDRILKAKAGTNDMRA